MSSPGSSGRAELSVCQPGRPSGKRRAHTQRGPWRAGLGRGLLTKAWQVGYPKGGVVPGLVMGAGSTPQAWGACQGVGSGSGDGGYPGSRSQLFGTLQEGARAGLPGGVSVNKACSWGAACSPGGSSSFLFSQPPPPGLGMCGPLCSGLLGVKWLQHHLGWDFRQPAWPPLPLQEHSPP